MSRFSRSSLFAIPLLAAALACGGERSSASSVDDGASAKGDHPATAGTDSVIAWAEEIRQGIEPLAGQIGSDPAAARDRAVELYVTRQERIERAVGPGTGSAAELAESVHEAEARFHELMELLGETPPPDSIRVAASVAALDAGLARVLEEVEASEPKESR